MTAHGDPWKGKLTLFGETVAGCLSGGCTRFAVGPLDVAKIRMQLGGGLGLVGTLLDVYRREGLVSLWRGSATGVSLWVFYMGVQFPVYRACKRALEEEGSGGTATHPWYPSSAPSLLAGGLAGAVATGVTYPLDWARTRLTMASDYRVVGSFRALLRWALSKEGGGGVGSMYRGLTPSILAVAPGTALTFGFYEALGGAWERVLKGQTLGSGGGEGGGGGGLFAASSKAMVCGSVGGGLAKLAVYPLDTVKKRMQVEVRSGTPSTTLSTFVGIVRGGGGVGALFRGLTPSLAKAMLSSGLAFTFYEGACWGLLGLGHPWVVKQPTHPS